MSKFRFNSLYYADGYKPGHYAMLAPGTDYLYGTWIPRGLKHAPKGIKKVLSFGQRFTVKWIRDEFQENFFEQPLEDALEFIQDLCLYTGAHYDGEHFIKLHKLGYLPLKIKALPEGIETPVNVPYMTFVNTVKGFAWLTLYVETIISALAWKPATAATIALQFRRNAVKWVLKTDKTNLWLVDYMCHDFSARGLDPFTMVAVGLGHATSFRGSDTLVVIPAARYYYNEPKGQVAINSVNASEHSVSCTKIFTVGEKQMISDWLKTFPVGILSMVMDTVDLTKVVKPITGGYLAELKEEIMARAGKVVVRPDSSPKGRTPVDIICGHNDELNNRELQADYPEFYHKGLIQCLDENFGSEKNDQDYKVLDPHIGGIYGDAINLDKQVQTYERLAAKGYAATNITLGVGSYTYQMNSRDTFGFAAKGAWFKTSNDEGDKEYNIYKDPITDDGNKKSLEGRLRVNEDLTVKECCTEEEENGGLLETILLDSVLYNETTLTEIRSKVSELSLINEE